MSAVRRGRAGPRTALPSYFLAMSRRYHRSNVSGVTRVLSFASSLRPSALAGRASLRRCASEKRMRLPRRCARNTAFSARRYARTVCWSRVIQPAIVTSKNCNGRFDMRGRYPMWRLIPQRVALDAPREKRRDFIAALGWHRTGAIFAISKRPIPDLEREQLRHGAGR